MSNNMLQNRYEKVDLINYHSKRVAYIKKGPSHCSNERGRVEVLSR